MNPEEPKVEALVNRPIGDETVETHPAYGQIVLTRFTTNRAHLYGSDFVLHNGITLAIHRSELHRTLSRDWAHPREEIIEIHLSESQWATLVSSVGMGSGVQCTLARIQGERMPDLPHPKNRVQQFKGEVGKRLAHGLGLIKGLRAKIDGSGLSGKVKAPMLADVDKAIQELAPNLEFVVEQFDRHAEKTIEDAKAEVNAYAQNHTLRHGLGSKGPLAIEDGTEAEA